MVNVDLICPSVDKLDQFDAPGIKIGLTEKRIHIKRMYHHLETQLFSCIIHKSIKFIRIKMCTDFVTCKV